MKRLFDALVSLLSIFLLIPVFVVVSLSILVFDGLPVLFLQERVGKKGKIFCIYKFRSMKNMDGSGVGCFDLGNKSRVTSLGKFLRKTKLDELPQLLNVLKGDMSLVGPRPEVRKWVNVYPERWEKVHRLRPGITDPASIAYRNEEEILAASENPESTYRDEILPDKLFLYEKYVDEHSFYGDMHIILRTLIAIFD